MAYCITAIVIIQCRSVSRRFWTTPEVSGQFGYGPKVFRDTSRPYPNCLGTEVSWSRSVRKATLTLLQVHFAIDQYFAIDKLISAAARLVKCAIDQIRATSTARYLCLRRMWQNSQVTVVITTCVLGTILRLFVPWNIRSHDGTFILGTIHSLEHSFPRPFIPSNFSSRERMNPADLSLDYRSNTGLIVYVKWWS